MRAGSSTRAEPTRSPSSARIVVIGGGVGGASVAYHLAELGERDIVVVERAELTSGSTFHSAGLVGQLRSDPTLTRMNMYSVELYRALQRSENPVGWTESGGIKLASSPERLEEIRRQISWARTYDLPLHEISPAEVGERFPLVDLDGVVGAAYLESDGYLDPSQLCYSLAAAARAKGVRIHQHTRVVGIDAAAGRVSAVRTDRGDIACEIVVNCAGMFAAEIGRLAGVRVPVIPMSHQYVVTEPFLPRGRPAAADAARSRPARVLPAGGRRAGDGRLRTRPGAVDRLGAQLRRGARRLQRPAAGRGLAALRGAQRPRPAPRARSWATWASDG